MHQTHIIPKTAIQMQKFIAHLDTLDETEIKGDDLAAAVEIEEYCERYLIRLGYDISKPSKTK